MLDQLSHGYPVVVIFQIDYSDKQVKKTNATNSAFIVIHIDHVTRWSSDIMAEYIKKRYSNTAA